MNAARCIITSLELFLCRCQQLRSLLSRCRCLRGRWARSQAPIQSCSNGHQNSRRSSESSRTRQWPWSRVWIATGLRIMFLHCWPVCTSAFRKASLGTVLWAAAILLLGLGAAVAAPADHRKHAERSGEVDTEHMFGFTEG